MTRIINTNLWGLFCLCIYRALGSDDYNDVLLGGHGTLHGYSNFVNPFLEVSDRYRSNTCRIHRRSTFRFLIQVKVLNTCR